MDPGTYTFDPEHGRLTVRTGRVGVAAKAGHDLLIEVTRWRGRLCLGDEVAVELDADPRSLRVLEGTGGVSALGDDEKAGIARTIDAQIAKGAPIRFRSTAVEARGRSLAVRGDLELAGVRRAVEFTLRLGDDARVTGSAHVRQTDWGIKPFSALFGTLRVADVVEVAVDAGATRTG